MQFFAPLFWIGAIAVAAPILLHLVRRERSDRVPFASLMFLRRIPVKEFRRQKLKYLLLLALRCLGLLLIVAAFARPVITSAWLTQANPLNSRSVLVLIDRSMSMSRPQVWERAMAAAQDRIQSLSESDEGLIVQFGETVDVLSEWQDEPAQLSQILRTQVKPSYESTSYTEALRIAAEQFDEAKNPGKEIFLITDLQRNGLTGASSGWKVPEDIQVEIENVGEESDNVFIEEVRLEGDVFSDRYPHPILIRLRRSPAQAFRGEVQLFVENKLVDRQEFEASEDGAAQVALQPFELDEGISRGKIVIDPSDSLAEDNAFYFVIAREEPQKVAVLSDRPESASAFYFKNALSSGINLPFQVVSMRPREIGSIDARAIPLVVMDDLSQPPDAEALESYVNTGGGLILSLGNRVRAEAYNQAWSELLPVRIAGRQYVRTDNKPFTSITEVSWEHPVFSVFQGAQQGAIVGTQFYGYWILEAPESARVLARFSGGHPALVESTLGKGRIMVFASSMDAVWTDFPMRSAYVPFWYQMTQYASQWKRRPPAVRINYVLDVDAQAAQIAQGSSGNWNVIDPKGRRVIGLDEERPGYIPLKLPGYYEIRDNKNTDWVAVNNSPEESDLTGLPEEELLAVFVPGTSRLDDSALQSSGEAGEREQPIWWLFLLAAALLFLIEPAVANRYRLEAS